MARTDPQLKFYAPAELKDRVEVAAKQNGRSMSAEIVDRLQRSFEEQGQVFPDAMKSFADELEGRMQRAFAHELAKVRANQQQQELPGVAPAPDLFTPEDDTGDSTPEAAPAAHQARRMNFRRKP